MQIQPKASVGKPEQDGTGHSTENALHPAPSFLSPAPVVTRAAPWHQCRTATPLLEPPPVASASAIPQAEGGKPSTSKMDMESQPRNDGNDHNRGCKRQRGMPTAAERDKMPHADLALDRGIGQEQGQVKSPLSPLNGMRHQQNCYIKSPRSCVSSPKAGLKRRTGLSNQENVAPLAPLLLGKTLSSTGS